MNYLGKLILLLVLGAACSGGQAVDEAVNVPAAVDRAIPDGDVVATNDYPDFDGDGEDDFVLSYGPPGVYRNTQFGVLVQVGERVTRFSRSADHELEFVIDDVNGDGVADLTVTWVEESLTCGYSFQGGVWVAIDGLAPCDAAVSVA